MQKKKKRTKSEQKSELGDQSVGMLKVEGLQMKFIKGVIKIKVKI